MARAEEATRKDPDVTETARTEPRTPTQVEADIERTRSRLAGTIDQIADRVNPRNVAQRGVDRVRQEAQRGVQRARTGVQSGVGRARVGAERGVAQVRGQLVDADGSPRVERIAGAASAVVALVGLAAWRRQSRRERR